MSGFMSFITNPMNMLSVMVAVCAFIAIFGLIGNMGGGRKLDTRMKAVAARRDELKRRSRQALAKEGGLRHADEGFAKQVVEKFDLAKMLEDPKVADKMAQAGYRGPKPLTTFYFFRASMPFIMLILSALYLFALNDFGLPVMVRVAVCMTAAMIGFYAPNIFLANRIAKRRTSIMQAFPDALDLLLICVEAGMSIEAAIQRVSQEIGGNSIELAEELSLLAAELSYLPERRMAYEGLGKRTNHPGVKSVATAMTQAETYGTPLGTALRVMAKENRDLRLAAAEKKAAALPAKLTVPMILFFLPVLFIVIITPAAIQVMENMKANGG